MFSIDPAVVTFSMRPRFFAAAAPISPATSW